MNPALVTDDYVKSTMMRRFGITVKKTGHQHWNGPCPRCAGKDRCFIQKTGFIECNQCGYKDWLDSDIPRQSFDPYEIIRQMEEQRRKEKEMTEQRWRDWSNGFLAGFYWREWHDKMSADNINWWLSQGITRRQIDYYELGYLHEKTVYVDNKKTILPAYTIPIRDPLKWEICNIHYRLVNPPEGVQKYRYEHGIPAREFYASRKPSKVAIVVEGAKKAMVVYRFIKGACQVVGLTSCNPKEDMVDRLRIFDDLILMLDPGAEKQAQRIQKMIPTMRVCELPGKPDDLLLGGMSVAELKTYIPKRMAHV